MPGSPLRVSRAFSLLKAKPSFLDRLHPSRYALRFRLRSTRPARALRRRRPRFCLAHCPHPTRSRQMVADGAFASRRDGAPRRAGGTSVHRNGVNSAPVSPGAVAFLQQGVFPVRKAPLNVQPPDDLTAETAAELRRTNRERWASVRTGTLAAQTDTIPHPFLGPLSSGEWMRFALLHARHHHALAGIG